MSRYQTLPELESEWKGLEEAYPSLAKLHSIGQSVQGRNIIVLQVSEYRKTPNVGHFFNFNNFLNYEINFFPTFLMDQNLCGG